MTTVALALAELVSASPDLQISSAVRTCDQRLRHSGAISERRELTRQRGQGAS